MLRYFGLFYKWGLLTFCTRQICRWVGLRLSDAREERPLAAPSQLQRFTEEATYLLNHVGMSWWGVHLMPQEWWRSRSAVWHVAPASDAALRDFMRQQGCSWIITGMLCHFVDPRRKDHAQMMTHHVVTVALIAGTLYTDDVRVAALTATVHNISDIGICAMKVLNYLKLNGPRYKYATEGMFALNLVLWAVTRLWFFPTYVVWPHITAHPPFGARPGIAGKDDVATTNAASDLIRRGHSVLLSGLLLMHGLWFGMLVRLGRDRSGDRF